MVSDSIINASIPNASKDFGKKKRTNQSKKMKQNKLDVRREQWLSQVKNKGCKEEVNGVAGGGGGEFNGPTIETRNKAPGYKDLQVRSPSVEEIHHDSDSESSPANSPMSSISGGNDSVNNYIGSGSSGSSTSSSSSFSSGGCCSGCITEEEEGDDDSCLDDWEAVADALAAAATDDKQGHNPGADTPSEKETGFAADSAAQLTNRGNLDAQAENSMMEGAGILGKGTVNTRAWRPDDTSRPQCLPNLAKQHSFPANSERLSCHVVNPWVRTNVPTSCPICVEDLDLTDSNFLPCPCGFRLCLFCHKRILEADARCPGCRKPYASEQVEKETSVSAGSLTIRLNRSSSMFSRV